MPDTNIIEQFNHLQKKFLSINVEKLYRPSLGEESLKAQFEPIFLEILKSIETINDHINNTSNELLSLINDALGGLFNTLNTHAHRPNPEYLNNKKQFMDDVNRSLNQLKHYWPSIIALALESRGFLKDEGIKKEYEKSLSDLKFESINILHNLKEESSKILQEAKKLAEDIEQRARKTAAHISVEEAQAQFKEAQAHHKKQVIIWAFLSLISLVAFFVTAYYLIEHVELPEKWTWQVLYYTAIRLTILTSIGALMAFCLKIFKANLHMSQHNFHRQRLANSIASFVESAVTPEQRDMILAKLVDEIADFGNSGLLHEGDSSNTPKMSIESITRTLLPPSQK